MDRSPASGPYPATKRPIKTRFLCLYTVNLATEYKSLTHYTKGTQSHHEGAPTACMHAVSGIYFNFTGVLSPFLTVPVHYRSVREYLAWRMVPPYSDKVSLLVYSSSLCVPFRVREYHPSTFALPRAFH